MGSGSHRKSNDRVRISHPQSTRGAAGGGSTATQDINQVCLQSFKVAIKSSRPMADGVPVVVKGQQLFVLGDGVGALPSRYLEMLSRCAESGILYSGSVVNQNGRAYARFEQKRYA